MKLPSFFLNLKNKLTPQTGYSLDRKLIVNTRGRRFPRWSQCKYLFRFLSPKEKKIVGIAAASFVITLMLWGAVGASRHLFAAPTYGGEYSEAIVGQPKYINPLFATSNDVDLDMVSLVYNGLFKYSTDGELHPDLATGYTVSTDGRVYDIQLRDSVKWSDGEPFTPDDVITTFDLIQNPEVGSPLLASFQSVTVEKTSENSIRFTLKEPFAPFLSTLTVGIVPAHIWGELAPSNIRLAKKNSEPIGTGAWKFEKLTKDEAGNIQSYTLTRNENYFGAKPFLKTVTFKFFNDADSAIEALRSQNVSAMSFVPQNPKNKLNARLYNYFSIHLPQYTAVFFNQDNNAALKNNSVRLALAEGIDKNGLLTEALAGNGAAIDGPILPGSLGFNPNIKKISFDVDNANSLLDNAGWTRSQPEEFFKSRQDALLKNYQPTLDALKKSTSTAPDDIKQQIEKINQDVTTQVRKEMDGNQPFYRRAKDGTYLSITITTVETPEYQVAADYIAKAWRALGVKVDIQTVDYRQILHGVLKDRSYQALLYGELSGADPDPYPFWHSSQTQPPGLNLANYSDRTVDSLLEDGRSTTSTANRIADYKKFQDTLVKDIPAIFLYSPHDTFLVDKEVKGITIGTLSYPADRFANINQWYIKTTWKWQ